MPVAVFRDDVRGLVRDEGAQLVEVLPRKEYEDEHLLGAISIPLRGLDRKTAARHKRLHKVPLFAELLRAPPLPNFREDPFF